MAPLPRPGGATWLERGGLCYALFPRAPGAQLRRDQLGPREAAAMGAGLAELHRALADAPAHLAGERALAHRREATLAALARYLGLARARGDALSVRYLEGQRAYLQALPDDERGLADLPRQVIHGDYTEANLFFAGGAVSAIIDWDSSYRAPRAWEAVRTLHVVFGFEPARCRAFLGAYQRRQPLPLADLDRAAAAYSLARAHDLWVVEALFDRGDDRPRRFLGPAGFQPVAPR